MIEQEVIWLEAGTALEQHELSAYWPPMDPETFRDVVDSVRDKGIGTPIILFEGKVLDGWHRYNAAIIVGDKFPIVEYEGDDPAGVVIESNQLRRHSTPGERADAVLKCRAWQPTGRPRKDDETPEAQRPRTNRELAREANASESTISRRRTAQRQAQQPLPPMPDEPIYEDPGQIGFNAPPPGGHDSIPEDDGPVDDWEDFPDFAPPAQSNQEADEGDEGPDADEEPDADEQPAPQPQQPPATTPRLSTAQQAEALREDDLRRENADLRQRLAFLDAPVEQQEATLENQQVEIRTLRSRLNDLISENELLKRENAWLKNENADLQATLEEMESE